MNKRMLAIRLLSISLPKCARVMKELHLETLPIVAYEDRVAILKLLIDADRLGDLDRALALVDERDKSTVDKREG